MRNERSDSLKVDVPLVQNNDADFPPFEALLVLQILIGRDEDGVALLFHRRNEFTILRLAQPTLRATNDPTNPSPLGISPKFSSRSDPDPPGKLTRHRTLHKETLKRT